MAAGSVATHLLVPQGRIMGDLLRWLEVDQLGLGDAHYVSPKPSANGYEQRPVQRLDRPSIKRMPAWVYVFR